MAKKNSRYCELCEACVSKRECPKCGADTVPIPKGVDPAMLGGAGMKTEHKCHIQPCCGQITHRIERRWQVRGKALPETYSCDVHVPGSWGGAAGRERAKQFYKVERLKS